MEAQEVSKKRVALARGGGGVVRQEAKELYRSLWRPHDGPKRRPRGPHEAAQDDSESPWDPWVQKILYCFIFLKIIPWLITSLLLLASSPGPQLFLESNLAIQSLLSDSINLYCAWLCQN